MSGIRITNKGSVAFSNRRLRFPRADISYKSDVIAMHKLSLRIE